MAKTWLTNQTVTNLGDAVYYLVNHLVTYGGWTLQGSGQGSGTPGYSTTDGTYFSQAIMASNSNAAWVRIQHAGGRELVFYRSGGTGYTSWVIAYSPSAGFTGGSPGNSTPPTASDQQFLLGSAITTTATWHSATAGTYHANFCTNASGDGVGFYMWLVETGLGRSIKGGHIICDPLQNTSPAGSTDAVVFYVPDGSGSTSTNFNIAASASSSGYSMNHGAARFFGFSASGTWVQMRAALSVDSGQASLKYVANSDQTLSDGYASTKDVCIPLLIIAAGKIKGTTTFMLQSIYQQSSRAQGSMLDNASTADLIYVGPDSAASTSTILLPWNGGSWTG